jgi:hypothetical protein
MPRARFEPVISATKRSQTYAVDRAATGIGLMSKLMCLSQLCFETRLIVIPHFSLKYELYSVYRHS